MTPEDWKTLLPATTFNVSWGRRTSNHRTCEGDADGTVSPDCDLEIAPADHVHRLRLADVDANGYVLARIKNVDSGRKEKLLRLASQDTTYWVVYKDGSRLRSVFVKPHAQADKYAELPFRACTGPEHPPQGSTRAAFRKCTEAHAGLTPSQVDSALAISEHGSPPWITCAEGCCNAEV